jgi:DNA-binding beta-propeller fold protein YncE
MPISRTHGHLAGASRALASLFLAATLYSGNAANASTVFAYGLGAVANEGFSTFDTATPAVRTIIAPTDGASIYGLTFDLAGTTLYGVNDGTKTLETINTGTGARTVVANLSGIAAGHTLSGLSINPLTGGMFLSSTNVSESNLYTIDPTTGVATLVGATGIGGLIDIAFDPLGMLFATDINRDALFGLDPLTGASTFIGALGFDLNFAQGMDFDFSTGILYAALYSGGGVGQWATIDTTTGAATSLFALNKEMEIAIARGPVPVPEPGTLALLGLGLAGLGLSRRRKAA